MSSKNLARRLERLEEELALPSDEPALTIIVSRIANLTRSSTFAAALPLTDCGHRGRTGDAIDNEQRVKTINRRVRKLENRFCNEKPQFLWVVYLTGWGLALDQDRCIEILGECGFLPTGRFGLVNLN